MDIDFAGKRLENASVGVSDATRLFGLSIGKKYIQRILLLRAISRFSDLYGHRALRFHPLKGDRSGQYSILLTANYRLVIEKLSEDAIRVVAVEDYHGD